MPNSGLLTTDKELSLKGKILKRIAKFQIIGGVAFAIIGVVLFFVGIIGETIIRFLIGDAIFMMSAIGVYPVRSTNLSRPRILAILLSIYGIYHMAMGLQGVPI